jgi:hypothetical protein
MSCWTFKLLGENWHHLKTHALWCSKVNTAILLMFIIITCTLSKKCFYFARNSLMELEKSDDVTSSDVTKTWGNSRTYWLLQHWQMCNGLNIFLKKHSYFCRPAFSRNISSTVTEMVPNLIWAPDCPWEIWAPRNLVPSQKCHIMIFTQISRVPNFLGP